MPEPILFLMSSDTTLGTAVAAHYKTTYRLLTAVTGPEASRQLKSCYDAGEEIALFLAEQQTANGGGISFLTEAGKLYPQARKALLADFADTESAIRSINEVGIDRYLVRPLTPLETALYPVLDELLAAWQTAVRLPAMRVRGIMSNQVARIHCDSNLHQAAEIVALSGVGDLMVIDGDGAFVGVLSEGDILRAALPDFDEILAEGGTLFDAYQLFLRKGQELSNRPIMPLVIRQPLTLHPDDHVAKAATALIGRQIRRLPVVENGRLLGTVSRANICQAVVGGW
ncbi:MAG: CBS domain-containing protein [Candidatus Promineifilaceae bacterium]